MHMCKQKEIKKWCRFRGHCGTFFSVIDFGKNVGGMQKLLRSTHKIILRISTLIKIQTILEVAIHTSFTWKKWNLEDFSGSKFYL